jgi:hypothetical protein
MGEASAPELEKIAERDQIKLNVSLTGKLPKLPPWVRERKFRSMGDVLRISDLVDLTKAHPFVDHEYVKTRMAQGAKLIWFEIQCSWEDAEAQFGRDPTEFLRHTTMREIKQLW